MSHYKDVSKKHFELLPDYLGKVKHGNFYLIGVETKELVKEEFINGVCNFKIRIFFYYSCSPIVDGLRICFRECLAGYGDSDCVLDKDFSFSHLMGGFHKLEEIQHVTTQITMGELESLKLIQRYAKLLDMSARELYWIIWNLPVDMAPEK